MDRSDMPEMDMPGESGDMPGMAMGEGAERGRPAFAAMAPAAWTRLRRLMFFRVVDHDDGDDAAERGADDPPVRGDQPASKRDKGAVRADRHSPPATSSVWGAFSLVAVSAQWALERSGCCHRPVAASTSVLLGAGLLIAAGAYQLTPLKHACLRHCRSPFAFITMHWRLGDLGALRMGIEHGAFCAAAAGS